MFDNTIPGFPETHNHPVAFFHADCELCLSTVTIFEVFVQRLRPVQWCASTSTSTWRSREREHRGFSEIAESTGVRCGFVATPVNGQQVAARILENPNDSD